MVVGEEGTNGGVWGSPVANTSRPTSSALRAIATMALIRSRSVGARPVVGSVVTSPTVKIPNCIATPAVPVPGRLLYLIWLTGQLLGRGGYSSRGGYCAHADLDASGVCEYCRAGDQQACPRQTQPGFTGPGSFAERVAIHAADANLIALPDSVDLVTAACLGCRFPDGS